MNKINAIKTIFIFGILVSILAACSGESTTAPNPTLAPMIVTTTLSPVEQTLVPLTPSATCTPIFPLSPTLDSTQQTWQSTAIAIKAVARATSEQARHVKETQVAQFSVICDVASGGEISPDKNWIAVSCGTKTNQKMIVKNKQGITWVLDFKNFVVPRFAIEGSPGNLRPIFWSPEGEYLYFVADIGFDGGGNQCFPGYGDGYGLFLLNLNSGLWSTLIPPTDSFPGYKIKFSPTGRRYAVNMNGITVFDIKSGDAVQINAPGLMDFSWSPDGQHLAYSVATCGEFLAQSASVYVWDAVTSRRQLLFTLTVEGMLLYPEIWVDNSTLRILGEKLVENNYMYDVYVYDIANRRFILSGTATPYP